MRQKYLNSMKNIIILLLGVTLLFSVLGSFNLLPDVEGMHNDDDAPACYSTLHDFSYNDDIPHTHHTHYDSSDYEPELCNNDKYILKTKIVPPKTTPCPSNISPSESEYLKQTVSESASYSSSSSDVNDSYTLNPPAPVAPAPAPVAPAPVAPAPASSTGALAPSDYSLNPTPDSSKKNDSCPPCPACERCPEPSFDCKKVPNYRSSSIGQYLPLPILTDFSKF
jgi:hypothetical protein